MRTTSKETLSAKDVGQVNADGSVNGSGDLDELDLDTSGLVEEQTGFPPYWAPEANDDNIATSKGFKGTVILKDDRDPEFPRYVLKTAQRLKCKEGTAAEDNVVWVEAGQFFTCSVYATLRLDQYIGMEIVVIPVSKRSIKGGKELWKFRLMVGQADHKALQEWRAAQLEAAKAKRLAEIHEAEERIPSPPA